MFGWERGADAGDGAPAERVEAANHPERAFLVASAPSPADDLNGGFAGRQDAQWSFGVREGSRRIERRTKPRG